jgi:hypothetical protein
MRLSLVENGEVTLPKAEEATLRRVLLKAIRDKDEQIRAVLSQTGLAQIGANIVATDDLRTALERREQYRATVAKQKVVAMK